MGAGRSPALRLAVAVLSGAALARWQGPLEWGQLEWGALSLVICLTLARGAGLLPIAVAAGWLVTSMAMPAPGAESELDLGRPVSVVGRTDGHWRRSALGWSVRLRVESIGQGEVEVGWPEEVLLLLPPVERPPRARVLHARGRLKRPAPLANGVHRLPPLWRLSVKSSRLLTASTGDSVVVGAVPWGWPRRIAERALTRPAYPQAASVARALVLGDSSGLSAAWLLSLRRAGLGHLLAVSGLHVGMVLSVVWTICLRLRPRHRSVPCGLAVVLYVAVVGPRPSLVRSAIMAAVALSSVAGERKPMLLNAWGVAMILMVLPSPAIVERLGFQLTAAATLGLLILGPSLRRRMNRLPRVVAGALSASIAAHVATLPWSLLVFHQWTPGAIVLNLIAVPWTAWTLLLSLAVTAVGWVDGVGDVLWWLLDQAAQPFGWLSRLPVRGIGSRTVAPGWGQALVATGLLAVAVGRPVAGRTGGAIAVLAIAVILLPGTTAPQTALVMLDVGQGESVLLRDGKSAVLVDGGGGVVPGVASREVVPALHLLGVSRLTGVVLTHPDLDHCAGLVEISLLLPIESLWSTPGWDEACYRQLIRRPGIRYRPVWAGAEWSVGRWAFQALHPSPGGAQKGNERSLVVRASLGAVSVLLTGDLGAPGERSVVAAHGRELKSTILKLGHHGSRHSTVAEFLRLVRPRLALVSSGAGNVYGHPAPETLDRLSGQRAEIWRTDVAGQIVVELDERGVRSTVQPWSWMKGLNADSRAVRPPLGLVE